MANVDDFKAKLIGGGARANLFKVIINNPPIGAGLDTELLSFTCKGAQLPASVVAQIDVPFRGRQLKVAGDRTFENWTITAFNESDNGVRSAMELILFTMLTMKLKNSQLSLLISIGSPIPQANSQQ